MSTKQTTPRKPRAAKDAPPTPHTEATIIRLGVGRQEFVLPEGATLADLLREAGADAGECSLFIDGKPLAESVVLRPGTIVSVVPRPQRGATKASWRETIGMFQDDPLFDEMVEAGRAYREAERQAARDAESLGS